MKTTKKILSILLALLMITSIIPMSTVTASATTTRTADEAIAWCESNKGIALDYDGSYGAQCVDLIMCYYKYLGVSPVGGDARNYTTNSLPSGWTRTKGGTPQKGDILIYTGGYGHVAIYETDYFTYHQNWSGQYVERLDLKSKGMRYDSSFYVKAENVTKTYWGCIHPDFKNSTSSPDIDWVTGLAGQYYLQGKSTGAWLSVSESKDASTQPINTWGTWWENFRVKLVASGNGYKINFPLVSSLLMNPYSDTPSYGTKINLYQDVNDSTQWWGFEKVGDAYAIRCLYNPSLVLTDNGVNQATLTTYTGASNQLWYLHPYTTTVSYNANGGTGAPSSQTKYFNENLTLSSTKPTRSGYTFLGWSTSSTATSATYSAGSSFTTNANTTLYAVWKQDVKTYTISYDANGGSGAPANQTIEYGSCVLLALTTPTRNGYTFLGWSESSTATTPTYVNGDFYCDAEKSVILYAVWAPNTYTISYNSNGGIGAPSSQTKYHDSTLTLSSAIPTRSGYTFLGWSTSSTATSATYQPGASFTTNANTTLYAVWQANVVAEPKVHVSSTSVNLKLGEVESSTIYAWATDVTCSYTVQYQIADTNIISCAWGDWNSENKSPLTITAKSKGTTTVTVSVINYETKEILDSIVVTVFVDADEPASVDFGIRQPSTTTIRYKDGIALHIDGNIPDGSRVEWAIDSNAFDGGVFDNGMSCLLVSKNNGYATVVATLYDANNNVIATDSVELRSKAGFFDKIGGFFRSLFGTTKVYDA